jgi:beta-galactosidase
MIRRALLIVLFAAASASAQRTQTSLNDGWRFWNGDAPGAEAPAFDDGDWERVDLPHTWNAEDAFDDEPGYRRGAGWYRRTLRLGPEAGTPRRRYLHFEGANQVADVWVNGQDVGGHVGGYTAFVLDVTDALREGENVIAVRVDNTHDPDIPPLDADFTFYGGIYRDVWLIETDPVHIPFRGNATNAWFDTPGLAEGDTRVRARARVTNSGGIPVTVELAHRLIDPDGAEVTAWSTTHELRPGGSVLDEEWSEPVEAPRLWSPETPHVYRVETRAVVSGTTRDLVTSPFGFRWVAVDGDGFVLNGERRQLHGTNRHQDVEGYGNALPDDLHRRDVRLVKETGFDFLRLAHYPQDEAVLHETDRLGLMVWEEIPVVNTITQSEAFAANAEQRLREMILQHYNHPSVVIWGTMNEILLRIPDPTPEGYVDDVRALAERLERGVEEVDPTRLTAMAVSFNEAEYRIADVSDIFAFNLYFGWYHDTFADLGVFMDSLKAAHPDVPLMLSEYGAGSDERIHADRPVRFDFSTEHAEDFHRASFRTVLDRPWMVGSAVWNQFDFGSAGRQDTKDGVNQKGLFFLDRTPKDAAFLYRAMLLDEPVIRVERDHPHRAGPGRQSVRVFSNAEEMGLTVNGGSPMRGVPDDGLATFEVDLVPGENRVEAMGLWGDAMHHDATTLHYTDTAAFFAGGPDAPPEVALNVGADHSFTDPSGLVYVAEADWPGAAPDGPARRTHHRISATESDARFQSVREMPEAWALPALPAGTYDLTLGAARLGEAPAVVDVAVVGPARLDPTLGALRLDLSERWEAVEGRVRFTLPERAAPVLRFSSDGAPPVLSALVLRRL